jgi:hypothetical protein
MSFAMCNELCIYPIGYLGLPKPINQAQQRSGDASGNTSIAEIQTRLCTACPRVQPEMCQLQALSKVRRHVILLGVGASKLS